MSALGKLGRTLVGAALVVVVLAAQPAQAEEGYFGWVHREDGSVGGTDRTFTLDPRPRIYDVYGGVSVGGAGSTDGTLIGAGFYPPEGQTLQVGKTYDAVVSDYPPSADVARLSVWRDEMICGKPVEGLFADPTPPPVTGWFRVSELEYDTNGNPTRFAATYEFNCQFVGGPPGGEGSVAVNSLLPPAPVPDAPPIPGPVTGLSVENVGPEANGDNTTELTWTNPAGYGDVVITMVQSSDRSKLPALLGTWHEMYRGRDSRYFDGQVEFMDTRTYRLVARGATGRLGPPRYVTVLGTRLAVPDRNQTITIGHAARVHGRLSESWDYVDPADVMHGPGLVGRTVILCEQSLVNFVASECNVVDRTTTTTDGHFTLTATPRENSRYTVRAPATRGMVGNVSWLLDTRVAPHTDLRAPDSQTARSRVSVQRGSVIRFNTSRARAGSKGFVRLQRLGRDGWRTVETKRLRRLPGVRRMEIPYREHRRGFHAYRIVKPGDARHVDGRSRIVYVRVR